MSIEEFEKLPLRSIDDIEQKKGDKIAISLDELYGLRPVNDEGYIDAIREDNPNVHYCYDWDEFSDLIEEPFIIIVEMLEDNLAREIVTGEVFILGEDAGSYIEKDLYNPNLTDEEEIEIFKKTRENPFLFRFYTGYINIDQETQKRILNDFDPDKFTKFIEKVKEETRKNFDERFEETRMISEEKDRDMLTKLMNKIENRKKFDEKLLKKNYNNSVKK